MKIKSISKLIISIILAQLAGIVGSFFTISAIPTWYVFLNKPSFSPPNWLFGPVWTILYTMIGISFYKIWISENKDKKYLLKFFLFHLFLNSIWSIIFFGMKELGIAFFEIILLWITIVYMIIKFKKVNKWASYLLIPYLLWVSFASVLNFSIWRLNLNTVDVFAQDLTFEQAKKDYIYTQDNYRDSLSKFNSKKNSYQQNQTLSLKEEVRVSLLDFLIKGNDYKKAYLTLIRTRIVDSKGLVNDEKGTVYTKIDPEVVWYENRKKDFSEGSSLEDLLAKSSEDDTRYKNTTLPIIYFSLSYINLGEVMDLKNQNILIYNSLKNEANDLVKLKRAEQSIFERWFKDIDSESGKISAIISLTNKEIDKIFAEDTYSVVKSYEGVVETLSPVRTNLLQLNKYISELETYISEKR